MSLLAELVAKGHRTLIFSQSRVMLDILQAAISQQSYPFRRIDGSISSATERQVRHSILLQSRNTPFEAYANLLALLVRAQR